MLVTSKRLPVFLLYPLGGELSNAFAGFVCPFFRAFLIKPGERPFLLEFLPAYKARLFQQAAGGQVGGEGKSPQIPEGKARF